MIKIENTDVYGWEHAIRGMRNPMNSWEKSDSDYFCTLECGKETEYTLATIGDNDLDLMHRLCKAGTDHRKFMRMVVVYADITAPLYWWKEYDTYKVGTVANSCSTMHKIQAKEFTLDDFSHEHLLDGYDVDGFNSVEELYRNICTLNLFRNKFNETKNKKYWWQMIQLLPTSYNQKRTVMLNYEVLRNMYHSRKNHKLDCWIDFCKWIETLPYAELITND